MINIFNRKQNLRGVNLGGWLVLEKWITPSLFAGTDAQDELELHKTQNKHAIKSHYEKFIKEDDFIFLSEHKINALRIPVGHWIFGDFSPFPSSIEYLDLAFELAEKHGFKILIDLHTAPGSQNGHDHSGEVGEVNWHKDPKYISQTLKILGRLSQRYSNNKSLFGISLLNEPHIDIPIDILEDFYIRGYWVVREYCDESVSVIISDSFRPLEFSKILPKPEFKNVILDTHFYQCFHEGNKELNIEQIIKNTANEWKSLIKVVQKNIPILCGEWSLGIDPVSLSHLSAEDQITAIRRFGGTQMDIFRDTYGWFFWTYKTESPGGWNFRTSIGDGTLRK